MTNYNALVSQEERKVSEKAIAQNVFTLMYNIRQRKSDLASQRRWVWELLQNAIDTTTGDRKSIVEINLNENEGYLEFKHNGNPFSVKNITFLVNQQSSKPKVVKYDNIDKTIGKYGTGFITTHLLSEKVTVDSIIKEEGLEYKHFKLILDRTGQDEDEIYESVTNSMSILRDLDSLPNVIEFDKNFTNTIFRYELDKEGLEIAKIGIADLSICLPFTMAFMPKLKTVILNSNDIYENAGFTDFINNIKISTINHNAKSINMLISDSKTVDASICFPFVNAEDDIKKIFKVDEMCPRIFCNFPLIGTEDFKLPFVLNSSSFTPYDERRNGINLTETITDDINKNKNLLLECKEIYITLVSEISKLNNWINLFEFADFKMPKDKEWLSKKWYEQNIFNDLKIRFLNIAIVETVRKGRISIKNNNIYVDFPYHTSKETRERIWDLCNLENHFILPLKEHIHEWHSINWWDSEYDISVKNLIDFVVGQKNITTLSTTLKLIKEECCKWLEQFYSVINDDDICISLVNKNQCAIFPNQNGIFLTKNMLLWDNGEIGEDLKDILTMLGVDCRKDLLEYSIYLDGDIAIDVNKEQTPKNISNIIKDKITIILTNKFKGQPLTSLEKEAFKKLYLWFMHNSQAESLFGDLFTNKHRLYDEEDIVTALENSNQLVSLFAETGCNTIEELKAKFFGQAKTAESKNEKQFSTLDWLINLGIHTKEQLEKLLSDPKFTHISNVNFEMLQKVLSMIERSKENVKNHLNKKLEYDCSNWTELGITIIGGIKKNNLPINLVIRPSDGGQVIFYYPNEKDALENPYCELWTDNGMDQQILTLGKIIKKNKIQRFDV